MHKLTKRKEGWAIGDLSQGIWESYGNVGYMIRGFPHGNFLTDNGRGISRYFMGDYHGHQKGVFRGIKTFSNGIQCGISYSKR